MIRPVRDDGSIDTGGAFVPLLRPRLLERMTAAARAPIVVLAAPAGFGKSVTLSQYLGELRERWVRFDLGGEHRTLLGFLDGLSAALAPIAPHARASLPGAYERSRAAGDSIAGLVLWLHAHLAGYRGVVVVDDLHVADGDPSVAAFLAALIARTKGEVRWIVASRSHAQLPIGTWLAYGDADLPIDERDLAFTFDEARRAAKASRLAIRDEELRDLLVLTEGWPTALGFALRTSTRAADLRAVAAITREMIYRFLAEQVYAGLDDGDRALLAVAVLLPRIDLDLLERAGFERAAEVVERLRGRTAFMYPEADGTYRTHELFRDFVRLQLEREGREAVERAYRRVAAALEAAGDQGGALSAFTAAHARDEVRRMLTRCGLTLLESAQLERVEAALAILPQPQVQQDAALLLLRGVACAIGGKSARAESLLRRAIARSAGAELAATARVRLALLLVNAGRDARELLAPVAADARLVPALRVEALSLLALHSAAHGPPAAIERALGEVDALLVELDDDVARAKVLQRIGLARKELGERDAAEAALRSAAELADALHLHSLASRTRASLASLRLVEYDDLAGYLDLAERSCRDARLAGDVFDLQMALLRLLDAAMRRGDAAAAAACDDELVSLGTRESPLWPYVSVNRSIRAGWEGRFDDGLRELGAHAERIHYGFDRVLAQAHVALFAALGERRAASLAAIAAAAEALAQVDGRGPHRLRSLAVARMLIAFAEVLNGRSTLARRWNDAIAEGSGGDEVAAIAQRAARTLLDRLVRGRLQAAPALEPSVAAFERAGYGDAARLLAAVAGVLAERVAAEARARSPLTTAETEILRQLAAGRRPKEIAAALGRSIYTVQTHVANAAGKLGCRGGAEAVAAARARGLLA